MRVVAFVNIRMQQLVLLCVCAGLTSFAPTVDWKAIRCGSGQLVLGLVLNPLPSAGMRSIVTYERQFPVTVSARMCAHYFTRII